MKVLVTGSTGLIGSALVPFLTSGGHEVIRLVRSRPNNDKIEIQWDPYLERVNRNKLEGADAVVHLSGESIAARWTDKKRAEIRDSRVKTTQFLSNTLAELQQPPKVLVSASGINYYGNRGEEILKEESKPDSSFLAQVCQDWEAATEPAAKKGIRVVNLRMGLILTPEGGALKKMLFPFKIGAGGVVGDGDQCWSWIAFDDVLGAFHHAIMTDSLEGPVNVVAPNPVTNREFTKTLARVLSRPALFPMPAFAVRLIFGEMADALLLSSARVDSSKLSNSGYTFRHTELEDALRHLLGKTE
ncbi:MAG: TIGR01777 family oxidoreductase [bacterium]